MLSRSETTKQFVINIAGSSTFGIYPKISLEKTYNMYISDGWLVDYGGYVRVISDLGENGRAIFTSENLDRMIAVLGNSVWLIDIIFDPTAPANQAYQFNPVLIGHLTTFVSPVYIAENNAGQVAISDDANIYIYDPNAVVPFQTLTSATLGFIPGFLSFHDTYFLCAASQDTTASPGSTIDNSWRLSESNNGLSWPADSGHVGLLETKPDKTQAVLRFPSGGNLIFVMGRAVTEPWFNQGLSLFPYQRNTGSSIDFGVINPQTIASNDQMICWLARNEKSGPVIMYSNGGRAESISTDGINHFLENINVPEDSEAFMFRKNGHVFYHINFYNEADDVSLFYDFTTQKFFHASDENMNAFLASEVAFFNNQYYFVSRKNGNIYAFDTEYTTYDGATIPRIRIPKNVRDAQQVRFVANDVGFTIEQGTTEPFYENLGPFFLVTEDGKKLVTEDSGVDYLVTEGGDYLVSEDGVNFVTENAMPGQFNYLVTEQDQIIPVYPRVDLAISIDGGETFGNYVGQDLNPLGRRPNKLMWWRLGAANDITLQFRFWGIGRFVATDGVMNVRQ